MSFVIETAKHILTYFSFLTDSGSQYEGGLHDTTPEVLHLILSNLLHGPKDQFGKNLALPLYKRNLLPLA